jgi:polar amino acid transport system permease protein
MNWSWSFAWHIVPTLLSGLKVTVEASLLASVIALTLGLFIAVVRYQRVLLVSPVLALVCDFLRGTPLLIQLYFLFYVLPKYGLVMSPFLTGVIALGLYTSAYTSEVYRAGIQSVARGQWEAAAVLGLPRRETWRSVIIPQAIKPTLPALGNYAILMFKSSAVLAVITVNELLSTGLAIGNVTYRYLEPLTLVGLFYWMVSYPLSLLVRRLERALA